MAALPSSERFFAPEISKVYGRQRSAGAPGGATRGGGPMSQGVAAEAAVDEETFRIWRRLAEAGYPVPVRPRDLMWSDLQRAADEGVDVVAILSWR